jgi:hypothetical protein
MLSRLRITWAWASRTQSQQAFGFMSKAGAPVTAITLNGFTHKQAFVPATVSAQHFLDQFGSDAKEGKTTTESRRGFLAAASGPMRCSRG